MPGDPLQAQAEGPGDAQGALAHDQSHVHAWAVVVAQAVAKAGQHTDRLYQVQTWAHVRGQAECRRVVVERTRAQIKAKA